MDVVVLGLGYIGLPTAAMLANGGHRVVGVDVNMRLLEDIRSGCGHLAESDVRILASSALASGKLTLSTVLPQEAGAYIICVPTPTIAHKPDLHHAVTDSDAIVLVTDHEGFRDVDPRSVAPLVRRKIVLDTRNLLDREAWAAAGFVVRTLGVSQTPLAHTASRTA